MSVLVTERRDAVLVVTLNRPERLNALDRELLTALDELCAAVSGDPHVRALVVSGAGDRAFCAGADVNELDGITPADALALMRHGQRILDRLAGLDQPVVAAVNGVALGGGCELAMACDLRLAAPDARFAQPEITLANVPGWGGTQRLPRLVGAGRAAEMILTGRPVDAPTALAWGLVNRVVDGGRLLEEAITFAGELAGHSPTATAGAKHAMATGLRHGPEAGLFAEAEAVAACCATAEQQAAVRAFLDRHRASRSDHR
ncbi:enoyl-CoA hydratase/isomerase family protein [Nonomuraea rhizosphaerae]|uniref:enoyl-CoA hydratase/isomerase family protein n=1 Tax=Nonomuraea rhizosphaerae TaxID=2665663 RepID=UPI001C5FAEE8|nr:enoyl-CoA hydratase/isomerase family protein [Nonomuraea rhizosphaerae]